MNFTTYFEHSAEESKIYRLWEESNAFRANADSERPAFTISMPPPNATGTLHLGHAIMLAVEDLIIRWRRMEGDEVLWVPGTDHAAIATESVVIKKLQKEGFLNPRETFGREVLVEKIADFVEKSRQTIRSQIRAIGASCDWSRERYTMQPELARCVSSVFTKMFRDGLIYRGIRLVNWDVLLQTVVSDDEIEHTEREAKFYTLKYGPFEVGTSRPETKLGDTAIIVHPSDERWKEYIGQEIEINWTRGHKTKVKVIEDAEYVNPEFGTGVLGVTPAHSQIDFEIAQKHNLPMIQVIGEDGKMTEAAGAYEGMSVEVCRKTFVDDLREAGLLIKEESYVQPTSICYRSKFPIEPLPKNQWFIDVNKPAVKWRGKLLSLRQVMYEVVANGEIDFLPEYEKKKYFHWVENLRDWCVSRQIWWGHRIPVWYRGEGEIYVGHRTPEGDNWNRDEDTLDTWFSSALWTWSTLIDSDLALNEDLDLGKSLRESKDFIKFHPTSVMETGYDILFFWVARMILMTTYFVEDIPFKNVYLHGLILDENGDKMSKSKPETCIDPLEVIEKDGADTLRLSLIVGSSAGRDTKLGKEHLQSCKKFINKIWNAAKLVQKTLEENPVSQFSSKDLTHPINCWLYQRMNTLISKTQTHLAKFEFSEAIEELRTVFWSEFCDFYLEAVKVEELKKLPETSFVLDYAFNCFLKLLHPFIPYVTEKVWQNFENHEMLIISAFPSIDPENVENKSVQAVSTIILLLNAVRSLKMELKLETKKDLEIEVQIKEFEDVYESCLPIVKKLGRVQSIKVRKVEKFTAFDENAPVYLTDSFNLSFNLDKIDNQSEHERLEKQLNEAQKYLTILEVRLQSKSFLQTAKPVILQKTQEDRVKLQTTIADLKKRIKLVAEK
jgi:valyl-tRNA synthetase